VINFPADDLDQAIANAGEVRAAPVRAPADYAPKFWQPCSRCRGTGQTRWGVCFKCKGTRGQEFKTSAAERAQNRRQAQVRAERKQQDAWAAFKAQQPVAATWIEAKMTSFDFAAKMYDAVIRYGDLTEGQRGAVERLAAKDAARDAERAERAQQAPQADTAGIDRLKASFDKAKAYAAAKGLTLRTPKITIGGVTISPAKADGKNPGALYVKAGTTYLGKIQNGRLFAARECTSEQEKQVLAFIADPAEAAKVYGQTTGVCCVCNATLKSKWKNAGIGPVCAEKMGWAAMAEDFGGLPQ
jgi:hypothetical protein